jgi:periplasmic protein TonB
MKHIGISIILFYLSLNIQAQINDTIWLNKKWEESTKDSASYYRISKFDSLSERFIVKDYYMNGDLQMSGRYISLSPKSMDGIFTWYYPDKKIEHRYVEDKLYRIIEWNSKGEIIRDEGSSILMNTVKYVDGEPIYEIKYIEIAPEFPGGTEGLMKFISENVIYPKKARKKGIKGRVIIEFVVDRSGKVINEAVFTSVDPLLDNEAIRVVKEMPEWKPGRQDGKYINIKMHLPINFK